MLSVFMTPCTNPTSIHRATSDGLRVDDAPVELQVGVLRLGRLRVVARDRVVRQLSAAAPGRRVAAAYWNVPTRRWLAATRASTAPGSIVSRTTCSPVATTASARLVGMPSACIASPMRYSRSIGPTAAFPSPPRANGVRPEPFRCTSRRRPRRSSTSPSSSARPSPSRGT